MPYVEKTGTTAIKSQLQQWKGIMHDPMIDGFNGWGCKQKIYEILWAAQSALEDAPTYAGEKEYLREHDKIKMLDALKRRS